MSGRCSDERKMSRGMMIGGERDRDGGGKRGELALPLGMAMEDLYHIKAFRSNFRTSAESGCARGLGGLGPMYTIDPCQQ